MNRPMGGWLLSHTVTMADRPTARPFLRLSPANEKKRRSWLKARIHLESAPILVLFLFGGLFSSLWNSFLRKKSAFFLFYFFFYEIPLSSLSSVPVRSVLGPSQAAHCCPAFTSPSCDKTNRKTLSQVNEGIRLLDLLVQGIEGGVCQGGGAYPITDSNEVKYSLADGGTRQPNGSVQSCSEAPVIQPSVLIKTLCTRSIPVDNRLHSLVEARRVYQRAGESRKIRDRVRAWGQCAYRGQVEWFKGASSRTPPGPKKGKDHRCTHTKVLGSHLKGHCLHVPQQEPTKSLALFPTGLPAHSSSQLLITKGTILHSYK